LEERADNIGRARAMLEQARLKNPGSDALWLAAICTEQRGGNTKVRRKECVWGKLRCC
jgi:pre-mRNA-processing factor 6